MPIPGYWTGRSVGLGVGGSVGAGVKGLGLGERESMPIPGYWTGCSGSLRPVDGFEIGSDPGILSIDNFDELRRR